jgi:hypothetical protein
MSRRSVDSSFQEGAAPAATASAAAADQFLPASVDDGLRRALAIAAPLFSIGVLIAVIWRLQELDFGGIWARVPASPAFWLIFVLYYFTQPAADWIIFRRLWKIPASGLPALLRKRLSNELLLGYSGELYFYAWARERGNIAGAPFGAIKDVAILSALAGNVVTLILFVVALPVLDRHEFGISPHVIFFSVLVIMGPSLLAMVLRGHLFSMPASEMRFTLGVHFVRLIVTIALTMLLWHLALSGVGLLWWLALASLQLLVSRLPFVPSKDALFAAFCVLLIGHHSRVVELTALMASLMLVGHMLVGAGLGAAGLVQHCRGRRA